MTGAHAVMPKQVDQLIGTLHIQNMQMKIYRPFATNAFIHVRIFISLTIQVLLSLIKKNIDQFEPRVEGSNNIARLNDRVGDCKRL